MSVPKAVKEKEANLLEIVAKLGSAAVAFSGGVDSSYLLSVCHQALPQTTVAVTGRSESFPARELEAAKSLAVELKVKHFIVDSEELNVPGFSENPPNRCYLCKKELFNKIKQVADKENIAYVLEASNIDDEGDYRPGLEAVKEMGVLSPLRQAGLIKDEIRSLSKLRGLKTWDKPSFACLASRFPFGELITADRLGRIDKAETFILNLGVKQVRVRFHDQGTLARIEADEEGLNIIFKPKNRLAISDYLKKLGFVYSALDLKGYETGSMNRSLPMAPKVKASRA
ncbi:MAG: ATP-dependent sacrificial sulfur transferase LarE [Deltaproteobacteria bacterium]|jgi:uncharacterized protein|nr:ATP-dependent sacrificial sulfur transferase LarE [Deltaproteobacteria bacterium]